MYLFLHHDSFAIVRNSLVAAAAALGLSAYDSAEQAFYSSLV